MTQLSEEASEGQIRLEQHGTAMYRYICSVWPNKRGNEGRVVVIRSRGRRGKNIEH